MAKKQIGVRVEEEIVEKLQKIVDKKPRIDQSLLINVALCKIVGMSDDDLNKAIGEYFTSIRSV